MGREGVRFVGSRERSIRGRFGEEDVEKEVAVFYADHGGRLACIWWLEGRD